MERGDSEGRNQGSRTSCECDDSFLQVNWLGKTILYSSATPFFRLGARVKHDLKAYQKFRN